MTTINQKISDYLDWYVATKENERQEVKLSIMSKINQIIDDIITDRQALQNYKARVDCDLQDRACKMDLRHDFKFSHYETSNTIGLTSGDFEQYAIMICANCGKYKKEVAN